MKSKKPLPILVILAMIATMIPTFAFADEAPAVTSWAELYKGILGTEVSAEAGYYDSVTSATNFGSHHAKDIPAIVNRVTNEAGATTSLDGVKLTGKEAKVTPKVKSTEWATFATAQPNKKYGTDELIIYPDDTVEGYVWNEYLANIYAVTISDGKTTAGAVPWIDYYGESATAGFHYNKIEIALNSGIVPATPGTEASVHRFDAFYKEGVLNPGMYTVTVYAEGYAPLTAEVKVPTYTPATAAAENADVSATSTKLSFQGLPEDYAPVIAVDGTEVAYADGAITYSPLAVGSHSVTVTDKNGKYNNLTTTFMVTTEKAAALYDGTKLIAAKDVSEADFANYIKNISKVTINETAYNATGRGSKKVIAADGSVDLSQTAFADSTDKLNVVVESAGYPALNFTVGESQVVVEEEPVVPAPVVKKAATIKVSPLSKSFKVKALKKAKKTFSLKAKVSSKAKASFKKTSGNKKITVSKTGKVTVKKGLKKGTYTIKVKVTAAAKGNYKAATKTVTLKIKVKK